MLVLSVGMQKSGSAYLYNIINDLLAASGKADARTIKAKYGLDNMLKWHNNNLVQHNPYHLFKLIRISLAEGSFAVKSHNGPTRTLKFLTRLGLVKLIYVYRDPRDVLVSAIDHGKKILAEGQNHTFAQMVDFDKALKRVHNWIGIWEEYSKMKRVLRVKYEDLMMNPTAIVDRIVSYLNLSVNAQLIERILWTYNKENKEADMTGLHFNKGMIGRHRAELTTSQLRMINETLGKKIAAMGYQNAG